MTTATEITTALTDVLGAVDEAKDMVEDLHDSQVTDGRLVCSTCQVSWPCETAQTIRYGGCLQ